MAGLNADKGLVGTGSTVPELLRQAARDVPDREAVIDGELRMTYRQLSTDVLAFARASIGRGVQPGDRVSVWAPNGYRWIVAALGTLASGAVLVPINTRFKGAEARYALARAGVSMLAVDDDFLGAGYIAMLRSGDGASVPTLERPVGSLPQLRTLITIEPSGDPTALSWRSFLHAGDGVPKSAVHRRTDQIRPDDVADILFTSGTTGDPKGAMTSHRANVDVNRSWADMVGLVEGDRYLLVNPLFHSFGYRAGLIASLIRRATLVTQTVFDPAETLRIIERERITVFPGAPTIYTTLLDHPGLKVADTSSVRLVVTGAAVVPVALIRRIRRELGFNTVITAYGQTETAGTITVCPPDAPDEKISTTSGVAIPGVEVRIVDAGGQSLAAGQPGEILARGINVMMGYWDDAAATAATIDAQGWLRTGDVGFLDDEGYLTITDRIKDMFTVGGFNVYPAEVERLLVSHPAVADAAVVGLHDERLGEVGHAYLVRRPGMSVDDEQVIAFCRENLANYKVPRAVSFVATLPRTSSGKVQKFRLVQPE